MIFTQVEIRDYVICFPKDARMVYMFLLGLHVSV